MGWKTSGNALGRLVRYESARLLWFVIPALFLMACNEAPKTFTAPEPERLRMAANQSRADFGTHAIEVSAITTDQLTPDVAASYGIVRSDRRAMLTVVLLKKDGTREDAPASGTVKVTASNLTGQVKSLDIRKIEDGDNVYYIGDVYVDNQEQLNFAIDVTPEGQVQPMRLLFSRQFYTD